MAMYTFAKWDFRGTGGNNKAREAHVRYSEGTAYRTNRNACPLKKRTTREMQ